MNTLDTLDIVVQSTLDFYQKSQINTKIPTDDFEFPLVIGSWNAIETGKILFRKNPAVFASESDALDKMKIDALKEVVVVSASGEKHAPILVRLARDFNKHTSLISSTSNSSASTIAESVYIFPKISEPYTYNTSTYFGYIYGSEMGNYEPKAISDFINSQIKITLENVDFSQFDSFFVVIPNEFALLKNMIETKFIELFGRKVARDVATYEQIKHAMTVIPHETELFICFGNNDKKVFGKNQINLPVFDNINYGPMMMISYFTVGLIQKALPDYFMQNIENYCKNSEYHISPLVEAK